MGFLKVICGVFTVYCEWALRSLPAGERFWVKRKEEQEIAIQATNVHVYIERLGGRGEFGYLK